MTRDAPSTLRLATAMLLACIAALTSTRPAMAVEKAECAAAAEEGQRLRKDHKYIAARQRFLSCARADCPNVVSQDCSKWLGEVEKIVASVVVHARAQGGDVTDVRVTMDGVPLAEHAGSAPLPADPGEHTVRYEHAGFVPVEERIALSEGERGRILLVDFQPVPPPPPVAPVVPSPVAPPSGSHGVPAMSWVLGGVGVAAMGTFAGVALSGKSDERRLQTDCAPYCTSSQVDPIRTKYVVANVAVVVGALALAAAVVVAIASRDSDTPRASLALTALARGVAF